MSPRTANRAFTLVELLVVVGVIALLIAMLLPALRRAKASAETTQCLSNLRQLNAAMLSYRHDNRGRMFPYNATHNQLWQIVTLPYVTRAASKLDLFSTSAMTMTEVAKLQMEQTVYFCPTARERLNGLNISGVNGGGAFHCWGPSSAATGGMAGSYMFNGWLYRMGAAGPAEDNVAYGYAGAVPPWNPTNVREVFWQLPVGNNSAQIPTLADGIWVDGWPHEVDRPPAKLTTGDKTSNEHMRRVCIARHNGKRVNVAFLDGHVVPVDLRDLWTLHWHKRWQTPHPLPMVR